jgi:WhiB family redox-sensing transcriptional regulator
MSTEFSASLVEASPLTLDEVDTILNVTAHDPTRQLAILFMAQQPDKERTLAEVNRGLLDVQGTLGPNHRIEGLRPSFEGGLLRAGLVFQTRKRGAAGGLVDAYGLTENGASMAPALFGSNLDVMLSSEFSLSQTLATGNPGPSGKRSVLAPLTRLRVLNQVLESESPLALGDLRIDTRWREVAERTVESLESVGALAVRRKANPADRSLRLTRPNRQRIIANEYKMGPEFRALHWKLVELYSRGVRTIDGASLLDEVTSGSTAVEPTVLWKALVHKPPHCLAFNDLHLFGDPSKKTHIRLAERNAEAISWLLRGINAVRHDSSVYVDAATAQGDRIITSQAAVAYLLNDSRLYSPRASAQRREEAGMRRDQLREQLVGWASLRDQLTFRSDWLDRAACAGKDPELFFPINEENVKSKAPPEALAICNGSATAPPCSVRMACLKWAIIEHREYGVQGGYGRNERRRGELDPSDKALLPLITLAR